MELIQDLMQKLILARIHLIPYSGSVVTYLHQVTFTPRETVIFAK